ncbi:hypothetical protein BRAS3809_1320004 [Bradyrhizobium sp. STM 3809]|nr:hypothetical protein BRAS3809_1320004 [Bradyrhizobium sp. STM 3809]
MTRRHPRCENCMRSKHGGRDMRKRAPRWHNACTIATRVYTCGLNGANMYRDRVVRTADGKFYLIEEPIEPRVDDVVTPLSLSDVFDWYRNEPWQIQRTVIVNEHKASFCPPT